MLPAMSSTKKEKYFVYNKYHNLFTHTEVIKYTLWFNSLSKNNNRTVVLDDLAQQFVNNKLIRSKAELVNAFSTFLKQKIEVNDVAYTVNIDEFLDVLSKTSRIIDKEKMDKFVEMENKLSDKTLMFHERRKLLLEYVIDKRIGRAADMEIIHGLNNTSNRNNNNNNSSSRNFNRSLSRQRSGHHADYLSQRQRSVSGRYDYLTQRSSLGSDSASSAAMEERIAEKAIMEVHRKEIEESTRFVGKVEFDFYCLKYGTKLRVKLAKTSDQLAVEAMLGEVEQARDVMRPLEEILDPCLLQMTAETRRFLYADEAKATEGRGAGGTSEEEEGANTSEREEMRGGGSANLSAIERVSLSRQALWPASNSMESASCSSPAPRPLRVRPHSSSNATHLKQAPSKRLMIRPLPSSHIVSRVFFPRDSSGGDGGGSDSEEDSSSSRSRSSRCVQRPATSYASQTPSSLVLRKHSCGSLPRAVPRKSNRQNKLKINFEQRGNDDLCHTAAF